MHTWRWPPASARPLIAISAVILTITLLTAAAFALADTARSPTHSDAPESPAAGASHFHPHGAADEHHEAQTADATGPGRPAHVRVWDAGGALLLSSWPDENGSLEGEDPSFEVEGPYFWRGADELVGEQPFWRPLVPIFSEAPNETSVRLAGYRVPPTSLGEVVLPKVMEIPLVGTLPIAEADALLGGNRSEGRTVYFLGRIPITIERENATEVRYRVDIDEPRAFQVVRSVGLEVRAEGDLARGVSRFTFDAPTGSFVAHNNCAVLTEYLAEGHYVVRSATAESLILTHYKSLIERRLENRIIDVEVAFLGSSQKE